MPKEVIQFILQTVSLVNIIFGGYFSFHVMNVLLQLLNLSRDITIGVLTPLVDLVESMLEFSVGVFIGVSPSFFYNGRALRVLEPDVLESFYSGSTISVISGVVVGSKDQQNGVMVRAKIR
jgi:hypothetical protein